jgi:type II secretory pathway pseudopilin PulG
MSYNVKVNGSVLPELYTDESIRGYAPAWKAYNAEVEVALSGTHTYVSLAKFLGEPEPPKAPSAPIPPPPPSYSPPSYPPPSFAPPSTGGFVPPPVPSGPVLPPTGMTPFGSTGFQPIGQPQGMRPPQNAHLKSGMAVTGLTFGILSFFGMFICGLTAPLSIPGLILSIIANGRAKRQPRVYGGQGMALGGIITNTLSLVVVFPIMIAIVVPNLLAARRSANQASARNAVRNIYNAQAVYESGIGRGQYAEKLGNLEELRMLSAQEIKMDQVPLHGYRVVRFESVPSSTTTEAKFKVVVAPAVDQGISRTGDFSYYIDETGILRQSVSLGKLADDTSPPADTIPDRRTSGRSSFD